LVIPPVNYKIKTKNDWDCPKDQNLLVKNGELLCGVVVKRIVGATGGGLVHIVWKDLGPEACKIFMSDLQNLINNWLVGNGFTVGVQDIIAPEATVATIQKALGKYKRKV
jgi:DNA-directed RNA polymerase II subunit RPB1